MEEEEDLYSDNNNLSGDSSSTNNVNDASSRVRDLLTLGRALQEELRARAGGERGGGGGLPSIGVARLQKLVRAELSFLTRLVALPLPSDASSCPALRSSNLDHLVNVFRVLQHPLVDGVSAVMQNLAVGGADTAHLDISCIIDGKPVWLILSSRNPRYIRWADTGKQIKGLKARLLVLLQAASADVVRQPQSIFLCFAGRVLEEVDRGLRGDFGAAYMPSSTSTGACRHHSKSGLHPDFFSNLLREYEFSEVEGGEWLEVEVKEDVSRWNQAWETYEVHIQNSKGLKAEEPALDVNGSVESEGDCTVGKDNEVCSSALLPIVGVDQQTSLERSVQISPVQVQEQLGADRNQKLVNLDTTALVALVSEVSNGGAEHLLALPQADLEKRFPSMSAFIREQALSELENPLVPEIEVALTCRQPVVSKYVYDEFCSIVALVGGPKENERASVLLQRFRVVPDRPSNRVMSLPLSGRIKRRHKIVFGTGDFLNAPTLTANMAFVRAARDKGMPISTVEHRPRALTGD
ncbi:unnamed protein product [Calypogeia fissa]